MSHWHHLIVLYVQHRHHFGHAVRNIVPIATRPLQAWS